MLTDKQVKTFFMLHHLSPGSTINDLQAYLRILFSAQEYGLSFSNFVKESLITIGHNEFRLGFDNWNELENCYGFFMAGFCGNN